jgi:hypothetical protein
MRLQEWKRGFEQQEAIWKEICHELQWEYMEDKIPEMPGR